MESINPVDNPVGMLRNSMKAQDSQPERRESKPCGGGEGTRTLGLYIANVALYQLSYTPEAHPG